MSPKCTFTGKVTRRFKETTKNGKEVFNIVVNDGAVTYPNVFKFKAKSAEALACAKVGEMVTVTYFENGREWTSADGTVRYFVDNSLIEVVPMKSAASEATAPEAEPAADEAEEMPF